MENRAPEQTIEPIHRPLGPLALSSMPLLLVHYNVAFQGVDMTLKRLVLLMLCSVMPAKLL
jgi:hypothetical protein